MAEGPLAQYRALIAAGRLDGDPAQELAAEKLQSLFNALRNYRPASGMAGWKARFGLGRRGEEPPQGLYVFGPVGRGKSMLMDLFFEAAPVARKWRVHFNAFMIEVHDRLHTIRQDAKENGGEADLIAPLARDIADETWLLCFDELQVTNIADAMILGRLFEALFARGVVIVATSNSAPDDLYKNGLQRDRFLPFIGILKARLDVLMLDGGTDYRLSRLRGRRVYHSPLGPAASDALRQAFADLTDGAKGKLDSIEIQGRLLQVPRAARGVAFMTFEDLCEKPVGAADYLALAERYHTLILDGVPVLTPELRNETKRFVTLIDALYEAKVNLVCAAEQPAQKLCTEGPHAVEFERTASRLIEMQADDYIRRPHMS